MKRSRMRSITSNTAKKPSSTPSSPPVAAAATARTPAGRSRVTAPLSSSIGRGSSAGAAPPSASLCLRKYILALTMAADVFQVLAEPRRREVLALVAERERTAGEIAASFAVTRQAISQHLRILLEAELISERREGTRRWYRARPEGLEEVRAYLAGMWPDALDRLKSAAEREHASGRRDAGRN